MRKKTNALAAQTKPTPGFLTNTTTPPQAVWAYGLGCNLRGPLTCATSIHRSLPCWLAPPKRPTSSVLASNNRERSQTAQPWTTLCIAASDGSFFLATRRVNGYALRACHLMMMMMSSHVVGAIEIQLIDWLIVPLTFPQSRPSLSRSFLLLMPASHKLRPVWCQKTPQWVKPYSWLLNDDRHRSSLSANAPLCKKSYI